MNEHSQKLVDLFISLSDGTRLGILQLIATGEASVGYLSEQLGESQPKVSRHLANLRSAGLVNTRRDGKNVYYSVSSLDHNVADAILSLAVGRKADENHLGPAGNSDIYDMADTTPFIRQEMEIHLL